MLTWPFQGQFRVYIDDDDIIHDVSLNQSNAGKNNNKFYRIQLLERKTGGEYHTWTRWGRVGEPGANATLGNGTLEDALETFEKKFKDKSGHLWSKRLEPPKKGKYVFIERSYEPDSDKDESDEKPGAGSRRGSVQSIKAEAPSELPLPVQNLMELIFNQQYFQEVMADLEYDAERLPLGKLSKRTMEQGYQALKVSRVLSSSFHGH
jgi:poly [ADP-ribose] polymerase